MVNLTFHGIGAPQRTLDPGEARYWVTQEFFCTCLDAAAGRSDLCFTFDDGNSSDAEIATPELAKRGLRGVFFPLVGRLGTPGSLSAADLRAMLAAGMKIGSHGYGHKDWTSLAPAEREREFTGAKVQLEELCGVALEDAACPFGRYDRSALLELRRAGFKRVFTSDGGSCDERDWLQSRYSLRNSDSVERLPLILGGRTGGLPLLRRFKSFIKTLR